MNSTVNSPETLSADELERLARKRAAAKLGWLTHAAVYVLVNSFLALMSWASGKPWAVFPMLGWGLGLVIHGAVVGMTGLGQSLYQDLLHRERARLASSGLRRDPW
jgi:hypothetical protein